MGSKEYVTCIWDKALYLGQIIVFGTNHCIWDKSFTNPEPQLHLVMYHVEIEQVEVIEQ
jgi:hypothetical protein